MSSGRVCSNILSEFMRSSGTTSTSVVPHSIFSYFSPFFSAVSFSFSCIQGKVFSFQSLRAISTVLSSSSTSLVGFIPFCASSMSRKEYSASSKQSENSTEERGKDQRRCTLCALLCKALALPQSIVGTFSGRKSYELQTCQTLKRRKREMTA